MRHHRRRWFAAPLVVIAAPIGCGASQPKDPTAGFSHVQRSGTACIHSVTSHCPEGASCNPPPPQAVECPAAMGDAHDARIGMVAGTPGAPPTDECVLIAPPCTDLSCATPTPCPSWDAPAPLVWTIAPSDDGRCIATGTERTEHRAGFEQPQPVVTIDCPPTLVDRRGVIQRPTVDAACLACITEPCDPATATPVACPVTGS